MADPMRPLMVELRAMGVRVTLRAGLGPVGTYCRINGSAEWTPEFSRQVAETFARYGIRELHEGLWGSGGQSEEHMRDLEETLRSDDEYEHIHDTITEHPDWSDEEIAGACGVEVDYVTELRYEWDR